MYALLLLQPGQRLPRAAIDLPRAKQTNPDYSVLLYSYTHAIGTAFICYRYTQIIKEPTDILILGVRYLVLGI